MGVTAESIAHIFAEPGCHSVEPVWMSAAIKTRQILTGDNVKLVGSDDLAAWEIFYEKCDKLRAQKRQ